MFDHTLLLAHDDPKKQELQRLEEMGLAKVHILPDVGCEKFAELVYMYIASKIDDERVCVESVTCIENGKNSAICARSSRSNGYLLKKARDRYIELGISFRSENTHDEPS